VVGIGRLCEARVVGEQRSCLSPGAGLGAHDQAENSLEVADNRTGRSVMGFPAS